MTPTPPLPVTVQLVCTGTNKHEATTIATYRWAGPKGDRVTLSLAGNFRARQRAKLPAAKPTSSEDRTFHQGCGHEYPSGAQCQEDYQADAGRLLAAVTDLRSAGVSHMDLRVLLSWLSRT